MNFSINNIGGKIKSLSLIFMFLGIGISVVFGLLTMIVGFTDMNIEAAIGGVILICAGSLISWVSCWLMYGFGQLIENSDRIADATEKAQN